MEIVGTAKKIAEQHLLGFNHTNIIQEYIFHVEAIYIYFSTLILIKFVNYSQFEQTTIFDYKIKIVKIHLS